MTVTLATVELTDAPDAALVELLQSGLIEDNRPFWVSGTSDHLLCWPVLRASSSAASSAGPRAGFCSSSIRLAPSHRRHGLGSRLLAEAEAEALRRGCRMAWLDTFDFQARMFYERHGYTVFGELGGLPNGHCRHFMSKRLGYSDGEA